MTNWKALHMLSIIISVLEGRRRRLRGQAPATHVL